MLIAQRMNVLTVIRLNQ